MMKNIILLSMLVLALTSCGAKQESQTNNLTTSEEKHQAEVLHVTTSIIPLASITNYIGGTYVDVSALVPAGVSPHGFDLKPTHMVGIQKSDFIVSLGYEHID